MDDENYIKKQIETEKAFEARCRHCGVCCGANGPDPCSNLKKDGAGVYYCDVYDKRLGVHSTISGKTFVCLTIRDVLEYYGPPSPDCGYRACPDAPV